MENNIFENVPAPEAEASQQPADVFETEAPQQPEAGKPDIAGMANAAVDKAKELVANKGALLDKIKAIPRKVWIFAGAGVLALIAVIVALSLLGNTYKTPIQAAEKLLNTKSVTKIIDNAPSVLNGFGESEAKKIINILKKSDQYDDAIEDAEDAYAEMIETMQDEYGKNYKISIKIDNKEKLEKEDLKDFRDQLRNVADMGEELDEMGTDEYEDMADSLGISKSQAKDLTKAAESFCKKCKSAKVTAGYELDLIVPLNGSELDEPEEQEMTVRVFKVDGKWVPDVFSLVSDMGLGYMVSSFF